MKFSKFLTLLALAITTTARPTPTKSPTELATSTSGPLEGAAVAILSHLTTPTQVKAIPITRISQLVDSASAKLHNFSDSPLTYPTFTPRKPIDTILVFPTMYPVTPAPECQSPNCQPPMPSPPGHPAGWIAQAPPFPAGHPVNINRRSEANAEEKVPMIPDPHGKPTFVPHFPHSNRTLAHGPRFHRKTHTKTVTKTVALTTVSFYTNGTTPLVSHFTASPTCTKTLKSFKHGYHHMGPKTVFNSTVTATVLVDCSGCALTMKMMGVGHGPVVVHRGNATVTEASTKVVAECRPSLSVL